MTEDESRQFDEFAKHHEKGLETDSKTKRFVEAIDHLSREGLGRAIIIQDTGPQSAMVKQTDAGQHIEMQPQETRDTVIGISMGLEGTDKHLLVFKTGGMLVTEPNYNNERDRDDYKRTFDANTEPLVGERSTWKDIPAAIDSIRGNYGKGWLFAKVTESLDSDEDLPRFEEYFGKAIEGAVRLKAQKEAIRNKGMDSFLKQLDATLFKPPDSPPHGGDPQPPDESPPVPQGE